jgi:hypothetical protein
MIGNLQLAMNKYLYFGEKVKGFDVRVLNERESRAGAGIMFFFAIIAFMNAYLLRDFFILKVAVIAFFIEFFIRVLINPKYAPFLIMGRFFVQNQTPEFTGAPQKRFAWSLGLFLATLMMILVVILNIINPVNLLICLLCLLFLFFETSFGICIGCKMYAWLSKKVPKLCPGGVCEVKIKHSINKISITQIIVVVLFLAFILYLFL